METIIQISPKTLESVPFLELLKKLKILHLRPLETRCDAMQMFGIN
jgi:hypothetical protein